MGLEPILRVMGQKAGDTRLIAGHTIHSHSHLRPNTRLGVPRESLHKQAPTDWHNLNM